MSTSTEQVDSVHKLRCSTSRVDPGGGGVNASRVCKVLRATFPIALLYVALGGLLAFAFTR